MLTPNEARAADGFRKIFRRYFRNANPRTIRAVVEKMQNAASNPELNDSADLIDGVARRINIIAAEVAAQVARPLLSKHTEIN